MVKRVSVIIPTYNRRERLAKVLNALDAQTTPPGEFEVVVVDDGSKDGTGEWLERQHRPYELRVIRQRNQGPAVARNAGVDAATGTFVLFIDDDLVPEPELVREHLKSHDAEPNIVVIGPLGSLERYAQPWVAWEQAKLEQQYAAMQRGDWEPTFRQFWTGNASVERRQVLEAGKFDTTFLRGEDVELGFRLAERGLKFRFNPNARGLHHAERTLASWENAHKSYGKLEVQMFSARGDGVVIGILAGNWSRLHRAARVVIDACSEHPLRYRAATAALRRLVSVGSLVKQERVTDKALSALANLLYWQASFELLGDERARRVRRDGDELRRAQAG